MVVNGLFKSVNDKEMESMAYKIAIVDDEEDDLKHVCYHLDIEMPDVLEEINYHLSHLHPSVTFYINGNAYILRKESILYCESFNHQTEIHFDTSSITVNMQLGDVEKTIDSNHFKRVGRSYLANMKKATKLEGTTLYISEHYQIPISRRKKKLVLEYMKEVHH